MASRYVSLDNTCESERETLMLTYLPFEVLLVDDLYLHCCPDCGVSNELDTPASSHRQIPGHQYHPLGLDSGTPRGLPQLCRSSHSAYPLGYLRGCLPTVICGPLGNVV